MSRSIYQIVYTFVKRSEKYFGKSLAKKTMIAGVATKEDSDEEAAINHYFCNKEFYFRLLLRADAKAFNIFHNFSETRR